MRFLWILAALAVAAPAWATTSTNCVVRTEGGLAMYTYSKSIASTVIDTCIVPAKASEFVIIDNGSAAQRMSTFGRFWNTGSTAATDSISFGMDYSVDGTNWSSLRNIALTGFVGGVAKDVAVGDAARWFRFRTVNLHTSTAKTVTWLFLTPAAVPR